MLMAARLRHIAGTRWGKRIYLDLERLREVKQTTDEIAIDKGRRKQREPTQFQALAKSNVRNLTDATPDNRAGRGNPRAVSEH